MLKKSWLEMMLKRSVFESEMTLVLQMLKKSLNDPEVTIVVELMGRIEPATFITRYKASKLMW